MTPVDDDAALLQAARDSVRVIRQHQHANGAYPASPTFSAYRGYSWLRDGAFIAEGMSRAGEVESASRFHDWVDARLGERREQVDALIARSRSGAALAPEEMLPTRFAIEEGGEPDVWWNFQTDGYGTWLWAVAEHARRHGLEPARWQRGIEVATDYAAEFWDEPCYDWWEENVDQRHGSTLGAIYGGLEAAATSGVLDSGRRRTALVEAAAVRERLLTDGVAGDPPRLVKWLGATTIDASLASCVTPFAVVAPTHPVGRATIVEIQRTLGADGGVHRYAADVFFGGGPWLLLAGFLGWNEARLGEWDRALGRLRWMAAQSVDGEMPEQVEEDLLHPEHRQEWIDRWGPVAQPLLWSHGMYLILAAELGIIG